MEHPALARIESGLQSAQAALLQGDFAGMEQALVATLDALAGVTREGLVPRRERAQEAEWNEPVARQLVFELLARSHAAGCQVFAYAGTLLGLERNGQLLANDKDADLGVWLEDFALSLRLFTQWGLQRATDVPPFDNFASFVDPRSGCTVDLFGMRRQPLQRVVEAGVWMYRKPPSHQRWVVLPWFELALRSGPAGAMWWPQAAPELLEAMYPDWRTPQAEWDSHVSNPALRELNLAWRAWALRSLCERWLTGDLARTQRLLRQVSGRCGEDAQLRGWREALEAARP